jgi:glycolate oxidase
VLTGEHGVGIEKRDLMVEQFSETDLDQQRRLKDVFDPAGLFNPGKVFPLLHRCVAGGHEIVSAGANYAFADLPRF